MLDPIATLSAPTGVANALPRPSPGHLAMRAALPDVPSVFVSIDHPVVPGGPTIRTLEMRDGETVVARATWSNSIDAEGHVALLHIDVAPERRRQGCGQTIFRELRRRAAADLSAKGFRLRRITCEVRQKQHIVARAFLTRLGFHHVTTVRHLYRDQDLLIYLLGCD